MAKKKKQSRAVSKPAAKPSPKRVRHVVAEDEPRERLEKESPVPGSISHAEGVDEMAEELGETFVENITGADDAAAERRDKNPILL